jgi:hypothetical protein
MGEVSWTGVGKTNLTISRPLSNGVVTLVALHDWLWPEVANFVRHTAMKVVACTPDFRYFTPARTQRMALATLIGFTMVTTPVRSGDLGNRQGSASGGGRFSAIALRLLRGRISKEPPDTRAIGM